MGVSCFQVALYEQVKQFLISTKYSIIIMIHCDHVLVTFLLASSLTTQSLISLQVL